MIAREHAEQPDPAEQHEYAERTASEQEWLRVNAYLHRNRHELAVRAAGEYPPEARVAGTPLLAAPAWRPAAPVPLTDIRLEFRPQAPPPTVPDVATVAPDLLPRGADGTRYHRYSQVVESLAAPAIFENRTTYRLTSANLSGAGPRLTFTRGRFFDGVDVGGQAAHEYAAARLGLRADLRLRAAVGDPCDLGAGPGTMAISTLTIRHDRAAGAASFPMHWRDPARVGHAGGMYQVIPVGVFQPSGEAPWNEANDFDLWRGMLREFAEELLGAGEDHGSQTAPIDYGRWPLANQMTGALKDGRIRAYCLGLGSDPLTFALDLLTVVVVDAPLYDDLFGDLVSDNAEGTVLEPRSFDEPSVTELVTRHPVQAAGAALLKLAITYRHILLRGLPGPPERTAGYRRPAAFPGSAGELSAGYREAAMSGSRSISRPMFARVYAGLAGPALARAGIGEHRAKLLAGLAGQVVEIGAGNGLNFRYYPPEVSRVVAVEPEPRLRELAEEAARSAPVAIDVVDGCAERVEAADASFDAAVACLVLCSVAEQRTALAELHRVLRPGGSLRFFEHVRARTSGMRCVQKAVDATFWPLLCGGCHTGRDTAAAITASGFEITEMDRFPFPDTQLPSPSATHILGTAIRRENAP